MILIIVVMIWPIIGGSFAFLGLMAKQGLAQGPNRSVQEMTLRQERWAGRAASVMRRRLWPIPVAALAGFIVIAANYKV